MMKLAELEEEAAMEQSINDYQNQSSQKKDAQKKTGLVCGRFQIFHKDHLKYVLAAREMCDYLLVGITSPDPSVSPAEAADANRGKSTSNPCTYYERMQMVKASLREAGLSDEEFEVVPFPIGKPELIHYYVPDSITCFVTIYDAWGENKRSRLSDLGYDVQVLWHVSPEKKGISASEIRSAIVSGEEWKHLVHDVVYEYIIQHGIDERIQKNHKK